MIVRYRSLGNSGNINSILCYLPTTNLEKEKLLTSLSIYRSKEWKKERKTHLIVPRSGDEEVGFGTEAETGHGISGRLIHLQKQKLKHQNKNPHKKEHWDWDSGTSKDLLGFGLVLLRKFDICKFFLLNFLRENKERRTDTVCSLEGVGLGLHLSEKVKGIARVRGRCRY